MKQLADYPAWRAAVARQRPEREQLATWEAHIAQVRAENDKRLAEWERARREAPAKGKLPPERPAPLEAAPPPFDIRAKQREWADELWRARSADAPARRRDIDAELDELEIKAKPHRAAFEEINSQVQALVAERAELDPPGSRNARAGAPSGPKVPNAIGTDPPIITAEFIAAMAAENAPEEDDQ